MSEDPQGGLSPDEIAERSEALLQDALDDLDEPLFPPHAVRYLSLPVRLSPTRAELSARCFRRHLLSDVLLRTGFRSPSAEFGTHTHDALRVFYQARELDGLPESEAIQASLDAALGPEWTIEEAKPRHTKDHLHKMLMAYYPVADVSAGLPGSWQLVQLEVRNLVESPDAAAVIPYQIDRLLQNVDDPDHFAVVDTKTSYRIDQNWKSSMSRSIQQRLYRWAARQDLGLDIRDTVIEGLPKWSADLTPVYHWASMGWTEAFIQEAYHLWLQRAEADALFQTQVRMELEANGQSVADTDVFYMTALAMAVRYPDFNYQDCRAYNVSCPFLSVCETDVDDRLGLLLSETDLGEPWDTQDDD